MLTPIPLLIVPLAVYNIFVFLTPGLDWHATLATIPMMSGASWTISIADGFLAFCLLILLVEVLKATRVSARNIFDHILSVLLFAIAGAEFLLVASAGTSVFALMGLVMLFDVIAGFWISVRVAQRDVALQSPLD